LSDVRAVALAIDALRRGWPIAITGSLVRWLLAIETADPSGWPPSIPRGAPVLLSAGRAATLKLANQREAADGPVLVDACRGSISTPRPRWPIRSSIWRRR
jgi:GTP cyclohydrolase II